MIKKTLIGLILTCSVVAVWSASNYVVKSTASIELKPGNIANALFLDSATGWIEVGGNSPAAELDVNGRVVVNSTTKASRPYPCMNETQRDALTPSEGDIICNTDSGALDYYDGTAWVSAGSGGVGSGDLDVFYSETF